MDEGQRIYNSKWMITERECTRKTILELMGGDFFSLIERMPNQDTWKKLTLLIVYLILGEREYISKSLIFIFFRGLTSQIYIYIIIFFFKYCWKHMN